METRRISIQSPGHRRGLRALLSETTQLLRRNLFGLSLREATFERRGFSATTLVKQARLESIGYTFLDGYHAGLEAESVDELPGRLADIPQERIGFAYEGAAMALTLLDFLTLRIHHPANRLQQFLTGPGVEHIYMIHVGAGWAYARLRQSLNTSPHRMDPLLGWLALDGYGFHEGYFNPQKYVKNCALPTLIRDEARNVFDQGLGRSLWFIQGAQVQAVADCIVSFPEARRADLWSGVGLACAYAGGAEANELKILRELVGPIYLPYVAQGVAFACKTRLRANNPTKNMARVCRILCHMSENDAAQITDEALVDLPHDGNEPAYQIWRKRIRERMSSVSSG